MSGCSYALANGDGVSGNVGLSSSLVQISIALSIKSFAYSVKTVKYESSIIQLWIILTESLWHWNYFRSVLSLLLLRKDYSYPFIARLCDGLGSPIVLIKVHSSNY